MRAAAQRPLVVIALLCLGVAAVWATSRPGGPVAPEPAATRASAPPLLAHTYFVDVAGWYRITPYETVVRSAYDLAGGSTEAVAAALPHTLGAWQQVGDDEYIGDDPAVVHYLHEPTVALQRTYQDPAGRHATLTLVGNEGEDSFLLFSHTPETCYPGRLWEVVEQRRASAPIDGEPLHVQYLLTRHTGTGERLAVLYWYLWEDAERDSRDGVLSMRVNVPLAPDEPEEDAVARAWDLIRALFPATVPWDRF